MNDVYEQKFITIRRDHLSNSSVVRQLDKLTPKERDTLAKFYLNNNNLPDDFRIGKIEARINMLHIWPYRKDSGYNETNFFASKIE